MVYFSEINATAMVEMPSPRPVKPRWLLRRSLHAHTAFRNTHCLRQTKAHLRNVRHELGPLRNDRSICINDLPAVRAQMCAHSG